MAKSLDNVIKVLKGMGKDDMAIWRSIKRNPLYKSYSNANIQKAFDRVQLIYDAGKAFGSAKPKDTLGSIVASKGGSATGTKTVTYSFRFARSGTGLGGHAQSSERVFNLTAPANTTKKDLQAMIRENALDWLESNYNISVLGSIGSNIRVKSIE